VRVLVAAFACRPGAGSEPGAGWAFAVGAVRAGHEVVLVTQPRHRRAIDQEVARDPGLQQGLRAVYVGLPAWVMEAWQKYGSLWGIQLYGLLWQGALLRTARRLHHGAPFDVAHHVTLTADWMPSGLAWVTGLPLVWGPLGGGERVPPACRPYLGPRGRAGELVRRVSVDPLRATLGKAAAHRAALLIAENPDEAARLPVDGPPVIVRPNAALEDVLPATDAAAPSKDDEPRGPARRRAMFAGRLLGWKGVHLALAVMQRAEVAHWELHLYGDGPERRRLQRTAARLCIGQRVVFHGQRPREEVRRAMSAADAFLYPSTRDAAPWVVAEALATGCPVVCLDVGGAPVYLAGPDPSSGRRLGVAVAPGPDMVRDLAVALVSTEEMARTPVRWAASALPEVLTHWYSEAAATQRARPVGGAAR